MTVTAEELADIVPVRERYLNNLRMLRRRDSHISTIFDQFAHVTVYYSDDKLEKAGYEGTMFFFERYDLFSEVKLLLKPFTGTSNQYTASTS